MHYLFWPPTQVAYSKNIEFWKYNSVISTIAKKEASVTEFLSLILNGLACSDCRPPKFFIRFHITLTNIRARYGTFKSRLYIYIKKKSRDIYIFLRDTSIFLRDIYIFLTVSNKNQKELHH